MEKSRRQAPKKKQRLAWAAYLELTSAAHWMEGKLRTPLDVFGVSREEFRLMVLLHRDGPLMLSDVEAKLGRIRESVQVTVRRAEEFGWVRRGITRLPAAEVKASRMPKEQRNNPRVGRRVRTIELAPEGERLIGKVLPRQEGMVRSLMGGLDSREMQTLVRICEKLRREDDVSKIRFAAALIRAGSGFDQAEHDGESEE
ncbi:MAG: hypothetical protein WBQ34_15880 [Candidatus Acidiferrales bacterium]